MLLNCTTACANLYLIKKEVVTIYIQLNNLKFHPTPLLQLNVKCKEYQIINEKQNKNLHNSTVTH